MICHLESTTIYLDKLHVKWDHEFCWFSSIP